MCDLRQRQPPLFRWAVRAQLASTACHRSTTLNPICGGGRHALLLLCTVRYRMNLSLLSFLFPIARVSTMSNPKFGAIPRIGQEPPMISGVCIFFRVELGRGRASARSWSLARDQVRASSDDPVSELLSQTTTKLTYGRAVPVWCAANYRARLDYIQ